MGVNVIILNWQRTLWEGDQKVVKRSGRDEPMCNTHVHGNNAKILFV
jgi:hypothetical protein